MSVRRQIGASGKADHKLPPNREYPAGDIRLPDTHDAAGVASDHETLSIVIPVYNEQDSLGQLHQEIRQVAVEHDYELDILFVDDGSTDESWQRIADLAAGDPRVRGIRFRRNFGKAAALSAGFAEARGPIVITMDADLQDDPAEIPRFLEALKQDLDVVSGWKKVRHDPWHKVGPSRVFNGLVGWLTGVRLHDHNCGFKCYRREIFDEIQLYGELHRFVPVLAAARGWRVGEVVVQHRAREFGYSKYGLERFIKGFLDLLTVYFLTGFSQRPQHLLGTIGIVSFFGGLVGLTYLAGYWLLAQAYPQWQLVPLHQRPALLYSLALLLIGGQFMSIGFLAELLTSYLGRITPTYSIRDRLPPGTHKSPS
jgi:glycosyltransferase involved in cell wall biosynthesis